MQRICLINMPFAALDVPSLGLTQLKRVVDERYGDQVGTEVIYLNFDFARYLGGLDIYRGALTLDALTSGIGEWFFRQVAFPELADNTEAFFRRYHYRGDEQDRLARQVIEASRPGLEAFLESLIDRYRLAEAAIVGLTSFFSQNVACLALARLLKRRNPALITAMGGPNCEAGMGQEIAANVPWIDYVFSGPALVSFTECVGHWLAGDASSCDRIDGVFSKTNRALWPQAAGACSADRPVIGLLGNELDVDVLIELDYQPFLELLESHFPELEPVLFFETSRGCWWGERAHCTFCGLNGLTMKYRAMSPENALRQFAGLFRYAPRCTRFECVDNIMPREYLKEVFPVLETPPAATLFYEVKADLTQEDMQVLARARVKHIQPGIEALATSTLKLMRKGTTAFHNIAFLKHCRRYDIYPVWNLLVGFPGEAEEVYRKYLEDLPRLAHLPPPGGVFPVRFDRFSPYYTQAEQYGLALRPFDFYALTYPFDEDSLARLAYYFLDHNGEADYIVVTNRWLGPLRELFEVWNKRWYGPDNPDFPELYLKEGGNVVYDSRSGTVHEHALDEPGRQVLEYLARPRRLDELKEALPGLAVGRELDRLQELGLLFQERGRFLSLVLPEAPPPMTFFKLPKRTARPPGEPEKPVLARQPRKARRLHAA